ncbi:MAG TPA: DoxX family protein [Terriglobales bacterium]
MSAVTITTDDVGQAKAPRNRGKANLLLWALQGLLAALFAFAGVSKLTMPIDAVAKQFGMSGTFLRFIGVAEIIGAIGLVVPWALRIRRELTPIAAMGLLVIMIGATSIVYTSAGLPNALIPFTIGCLLAVVGYGRGRECR